MSSRIGVNASSVCVGPHWTVTLPAPWAGQMATNGQSRQCGPAVAGKFSARTRAAARASPSRRTVRSAPSAVVGRLALDLGARGVVVDAELHELGAARRHGATGRLVEGARVDGVLVERELEVARDGRPGRRGRGRS